MLQYHQGAPGQSLCTQYLVTPPEEFPRDFFPSVILFEALAAWYFLLMISKGFLPV